jgi:hypothetical protein
MSGSAEATCLLVSTLASFFHDTLRKAGPYIPVEQYVAFLEE